MPLANGRAYLAIPGPSVLPDRVLAAMQRPSPNIYSGELVDMVAGIWPDLKALAGTAGHVAAYICNGHGAWEAANSTCFRVATRLWCWPPASSATAGPTRHAGLGLRCKCCTLAATPPLTRLWSRPP